MERETRARIGLALVGAALVGYVVGAEFVGKGRLDAAMVQAEEEAGLIYLAGLCTGGHDMAERWAEEDSLLDLSKDQLVDLRMESAVGGWDLGAISVPPFNGGPAPPVFLDDLRAARMSESEDYSVWGWRAFCSEGTRPYP